MAMRDDFAVLILTHGRANKMYTLKTLNAGNYTGRWYMVIDNEDDQEAEYIRKFGADHVVKFDKQAVYDRIDTMDTFGEHRAIIYARNEAFNIAKSLGLKYFLELDDDYTSFEFRYVDNGRLKVRKVHNLDRLFTDMIEYLETSNALTVALAQGGDFIGGANSKRFHEKVIRKAMNSFFCRTDRPINFVGTINEDVNMYTILGNKGELIMSITDVAIVQGKTQKNKGGMSELYLDDGTYVKSFYSVIGMPSAVRIEMMGDKHLRIHHKIRWENCVPKIINQKWQK